MGIDRWSCIADISSVLLQRLCLLPFSLVRLSFILFDKGKVQTTRPVVCRSPAARRQTEQAEEEEEEKEWKNDCESIPNETMTTDLNASIEVPRKSYQIYTIERTEQHSLENSLSPSRTNASIQDNFVSWSNGSFNMDYPSVTNTNSDDFAKWARRYLYGVGGGKVTAVQRDNTGS